MNQRSAFVLVAVGLVLGLGERAADAGLVTWQFSGEIIDVLDVDNDLGGAITVGTPFSGSFTFESETPDSNPSDPGIGLYDDSVMAVSGQIGDLLFLGSDELSSTIGVRDFHVGVDNDQYRLVVNDIDIPVWENPFRFSLLVADADGSFFGNDSLPLSPPDLASSIAATVSFRADGNGSDILISGNLQVLVPEPGSLTLLAIGAIALVRRKRPSRSPGMVIILLVLGFGMCADLRAQQWDPDWGPVIIGGDDLDDHRTTIGVNPPVLLGDAFIPAGFKFLAANVKNNNKIAVCIGCNPGTAVDAFNDGFDAADLVGWTREQLVEADDIIAFFDNDITATLRIEDAGIIYMPTDVGQASGGIAEFQIARVNLRAVELRNFVKVDGGGLFTHSLFNFVNQNLNGFLWLETLVPEIRPMGPSLDENGLPIGVDLSPLSCEGDDVFFPGITDAQRDAVTLQPRAMVPAPKM